MSGTSEAAGTGFLDLPADLRDPGRARVFVLPIPYEATVSYGTGTQDGPDAIIAASHQLELYDHELETEPALDFGIHTLPALATSWVSGEEAMEEIARVVTPIVQKGKFLLALGGEHSISQGIVRGIRLTSSDSLTVVQIDAHADLRDSYNGSRFSHACTMRRILDENPGETVQLGVRSYSKEEADFINGNRGRVNLFTAERIHETFKSDFLRELKGLVKGRKIYLTIDVDGLDPSIVPSTGTPEPGGLTWFQALGILKTIAESAQVVGMDCVELAPRPGMHASEFTVAKLLYKTMSHVLA